MKIYSMTATFGKLEHETLTLRPGLNIIHAPNEWGKSTWCAFLIAMLYGIETRVHSTKSALADKERYAPWSGSPMSGSMDLCWQGRDITIQRQTKGRSVFGVFRAFETHTGVEVPELTAANCGQQLLGVEKSVFTRAGFLKLTDLPVTEDQALWRRLNALVTTGDESGASDALAQKLKDLKNQCRSNRANGLIPQALAQKGELENKLSQLKELHAQSQKIQSRQQELTDFAQKLAAHEAALEYEAAKEQLRRADLARLQLKEITARAEALQQECALLPSAETLHRDLARLHQLRQQQESIRMDAQMLPSAPTPPQIPAPFHGCTPEQALEQAREDQLLYSQYQSHKKKPSTLLFILGICLTGTGLVSFALTRDALTLAILALGVILAVVGFLSYNRGRQDLLRQEAGAQALADRYRPLAPDSWTDAAQAYATAQAAYLEALSHHSQSLSHVKDALQTINEQLNDLTQGRSCLQCEESWRNALARHTACADALRQQKQAEDVAQALGRQKPLPPPPGEDTLTFSPAETARLRSDTDFELRQLQNRLGRCQGQMEALGQEQALENQLSEAEERLTRLNETYAALELAQETLSKASLELQRRFAPRISQRAQAIFSRLTGSRYDRLTLGSDMSLLVSAQQEDILRGSLWRSDGTVDQLYLALRLAVAEELTPQAPLILDDALVRFDDTRLSAAMDVLKEEAESKQVLLFTCQSRETRSL